MASVTITVNKNTITQNQATATVSASGFSVPPSQTSNWSNVGGPTYPDPDTQYQLKEQTVTTYSFNNNSYSWSFSSGSGRLSGSSGSHTFTGLTAGASNPITATVTVTAYASVQTRRRTDTSVKKSDGTWSSPTPGTPYDYGPPTSGGSQLVGSARGSANVVTRPDTFSWNSSMRTDQIIEDGLPASDWNRLVETAEKKQNFLNQATGTSYSGDRVSSGDIITASKYNSLAAHCGCATRVSNNHQNNNSMITAAVFDALADAVNS